MKRAVRRRIPLRGLDDQWVAEPMIHVIRRAGAKARGKVTVTLLASMLQALGSRCAFSIVPVDETSRR